MSQNNKINIVDAIKEKPVISSLCAAWAPVAYVVGSMTPAQSAVGENILQGLFYSAPAACAAVAVIGGLNTVRNKSLLSKPFSLFALGAGVTSVLAWRQGMADSVGDTSGLAAGMTALFTGFAASVGGASNLVSHYTRNVGPQIGITPPGNDPKPKSCRKGQKIPKF